ncbi:MAG TPA: amidotransferase [Planctomycetota bacterium]|nr:amidotransferase [Planctomycetota bacterium]
MSDVIVLQHAAPEGPAAIAGSILRRGLGLRTVRIDRGDPVPGSLDGAAGLVVMGGPMGVYEKDQYPHLAPEIGLLQQALRDGVPTLGVCLGSQLLAASLGARVFPSGRKEIGWHEVQLLEGARADPLWKNAPERFTPLHWHGDIFDLPPGAVPLASSAMTELQAFRSGTNAYGILFHLEIGGAEVREMVATFSAELAAAKIPSGPIVAGIEAHLASVEHIGKEIFDRWAGLAADRR